MTAEDLRKAILQQAIQGKLVPQNPNDEPASILLERIREEKARLVKEKKIKKDKNESIIFRGDDNSHYEKILATGEVKCIDDEIPFEIPESWAWCRLGEILTVKGGKRLPLGASFSNEPTPHIYIRVTEMKNGTLVDNNLRYISHEIFEQIKNYTISKNDLYLTIAGTIGSVGIVPEKFDGMNLTENAVKLTNILVEKYYLLRIISSALVQNQFVDKTKQVAQPKLAIERIITTLIPLPPLSEQKRIVSRIEELMTITDKFEKAKIELDQLESELQPLLKKSILQYAIQGKLVPQDSNDEPASILLERIREEKARLVKEKKIKKDKNESIIYKGEDNSYYEKTLATGKIKCIDDEIPFEIPNSWEWVRMGEIFQHNTGKALNSSNTIGKLKKYLTTSNVYWNTFDFSKLKEMYFKDDEIDKYSISKGDLLVCEGGDVGRAAIWKYDEEMYIQNHIHRLRAYSNVCTKYFYYIFFFFKTSGIIGGKGIGIQGLSANTLHNILIPIPPLEEQKRIVEALDNVLANINRGL